MKDACPPYGPGNADNAHSHQHVTHQYFKVKSINLKGIATISAFTHGM